MGNNEGMNVNDQSLILPEGNPLPDSNVAFFKRHKTLTIVSIVFVVIIILFIISREIHEAYVVSKAPELFLEVISPQIKEERDEAFNGRLAEGPEDAKDIVEENKKFQLERIARLKTNGEDIAMIDNFIIGCKERNITNAEKILGISCNSTGSIYNTGEKVNITINKSSYWMVSLFASSLLISLQDDMLGFIENETNVDSSDEISGKTLGIIMGVEQLTVYWSTIIPTINDIYSDNGLEGWNPDVPPIEKDLTLEIPKFESYVNSILLPSRDQIKEVSFSDACVNSIRNTANEMGIFGSARIRSIWDQIFFSNTYEDICDEVERYQVRKMLRLHEIAENEQNPFLSFHQKQLLALYINCPEDWISQSNECTSNYMNKFELDIISKLT